MGECRVVRWRQYEGQRSGVAHAFVGGESTMTTTTAELVEQIVQRLESPEGQAELAHAARESAERARRLEESLRIPDEFWNWRVTI